MTFQFAKSFLVTFLFTALCSASASASPGDYMDVMQNVVASEVQACGYKIVSGDDGLLEDLVLARHVTQVMVKGITATGKYSSVVLIDKKIQNQNLALTYSIASNGSYIWSAARDFDMNDLQVQSAKFGTVAHSSSYFQGSQSLQTRFWVRQIPGGDTAVDATYFYNFLHDQVAHSFANAMCTSTLLSGFNSVPISSPGLSADLFR